MKRFLVNLLYFVALHLTSTSAEPVPVDGESLFDTSNINVGTKYKMPASCKTDNFCFEEGNEYPKDTIKNIVDRLPFLLFDVRIGTSLTYRSSDNNDSDCPHDDSFSDKPIYYIRDENDKVRVVVQEKRFPQIYNVKWCKRSGLITYDTPHFLANSTLLKHYQIECVNTTMNFDFLVLSDTEENVELARPKGGLPVCCKCRYPKPN